MPEDALLSWGWRIPFLLSAIVMLVGWWIRRSLGESPAFEEEQEHHDVPKAPLKVLFRNYTPDVFKVLFAALASVNSTIFGQFALAYGVNTMGLSRSAFLWLAILVNFVALFTIPVAGFLADRVRPQACLRDRHVARRRDGLAIPLGDQSAQHR